MTSLRDKVIAVLSEQLQSSNEALRCFSSVALGEIKATSVVSTLASLLHDEDIDVVLDACVALGEIKDDSAVPHLIESYQHDPSGEVKVAVTEALGKIGSATANQKLIEILQNKEDSHEWQLIDSEWDDWWDVQLKAVHWLGENRVEKAVTILQEMIHVEDQDLSEYALNALAKIGGSGLPILLKCLQDENSVVRQRTVRSLLSTKLEQPLQALLPLLNDSEDEVVSRVIQAIFQLEQQDIIIDDLKTNLEKYPSKIQSTIIQELKAHFQENDVDLILPFLNDSAPEVRIQAIQYLSLSKQEKVILPILEKIADEKTEVSVQALTSAGELEHIAAGIPLKGCLEDHSFYKDYRAIAAESLGKLQDVDAVPNLIQALTDEHPAIRLNSLQSIIQIQGEEALALLKSALHGQLVTPEKTVETEANLEKNQEEQTEANLEKNQEEQTEASLEKNQEEQAETEEKESTIEEATQDNDEAQEEKIHFSTLEALLATPKIVEEQKEEIDFTTDFTDKEKEFLEISKRREQENANLIFPEPVPANIDIQRLSANLLTKFPVEKVEDDLIEALQTSDSLVKKEVITSLGILKSQKAVSSLSELLNDKDEEIRFETIQSLGQIGDNRIASLIFERFPNENSFIQTGICEALGNLQVKEYIPQLTEHLQTADYFVKLALIKTLIQLDAKESVTQIVASSYLHEGEQRRVIGSLLKNFYPDLATEEYLKTLSDPKKENLFPVSIEALGAIYSVA